MRLMSLLESRPSAASQIARAAAATVTGSQRSAWNSMVLYADKTGSLSTQMVLLPALGAAAGLMYGTSGSSMSKASASLGSGPVP
jgi:hypothetical protein